MSKGEEDQRKCSVGESNQRRLASGSQARITPLEG
ncbi:hypothetical protein NC652_013853 [Populus alba x Populus x berolinensis]|uniref:Uncharacterized protein n=1 Tax=Populus alba x Populus x berolinensis TaxID=444605 RepID=A0AAD6QVJ5_9ROSI|nr:hypothetical protein NC652_013853 [Populus alba x Populus x berolinensis]KAJ6997377.1 hypothetical protein NC653_013824 [Populus alba x Populus x berolinensis]